MTRLVFIFAAIVGLAGEWVTREDTGARVCRLTTTLLSYQALVDGFCEDWQIPPLRSGMLFPREERGWVRCRDGCQLHIENRGWRP